MAQAAVHIPDSVRIEYDREFVRRYGLPGFVDLAWSNVSEPTTALKWGWALDAICDHLMAVSNGEITRLLMNVPPGMMKSYLTSVLWPAYEWGPLNRPHLSYIATSYSDAVSTRDSRRMRNLVRSKWFQDRWPCPLTRWGETSFENESLGAREAMAFNSLTGGRADRVIADDPHSTETAESDAERKRTIRTWRESVPTRVNDPEHSAIIVIMQRLHVADVSGDIIEDNKTAEEFEKYVHLYLPMEFESQRRCSTRIGFTDPRTEEGELLFPERFPRHVVDRDKKKLGSFATAGQLQQRPAPRGGYLVKSSWFEQRFKMRGKKPMRLILSIDCASKPDQRNDPSACLWVAQFRDRYEFWKYSSKRMEFPDLVRYTKDQYAAAKEAGHVTAVLIEDKDAGQQLIQTLKRSTTMPVIAINPGNLDKLTRLDAVTPLMEAENVVLPDNEPWVADFLAELTTIPSAPHDETGDTTSQALKWLEEKKAGSMGAGPVGTGKESQRV